MSSSFTSSIDPVYILLDVLVFESPEDVVGLAFEV